MGIGTISDLKESMKSEYILYSFWSVTLVKGEAAQQHRPLTNYIKKGKTTLPGPLRMEISPQSLIDRGTKTRTLAV
jgi:hypothetical protein